MPRGRPRRIKAEEEVIEEVESVSSGSMSVEETLDQLTREMDEAKAEIEKRQKISASNKSTRANGRAFEEMILRACEAYKADGTAMVNKVPEARRVVGRTGGRSSMMICVNAAKADPDFMGSVAPKGKCIVFDAKHTDKDRILLGALTDHQREIMDRHMACGADCYVCLSFGFKGFYMIPYAVWKDMKTVFGRQYILPEDKQIQKYAIPSSIVGQDRKGNELMSVWFLGKVADVPAAAVAKAEDGETLFE